MPCIHCPKDGDIHVMVVHARYTRSKSRIATTEILPAKDRSSTEQQAEKRVEASRNCTNVSTHSIIRTHTHESTRTHTCTQTHQTTDVHTHAYALHARASRHTCKYARKRTHTHKRVQTRAMEGMARFRKLQADRTLHFCSQRHPID